MRLTFRLVCYIVLTCHILSAKAQYKSDLYCYYMKDCQQYCPRDGISKLDRRFLKSAVEASDGNVDDMTSGAVNGFYRPRSALARAMYEKQHNDRYLRELDQNEVSCVSFII